MRIVKRAGIFFVLLMIFIGWQPAAAQNINSHWFPETRHSVKGEFFSFYFSVKDPQMYFGYPITDEFRDATTGRLTQYFQRARFDLIISDKGPVVNLANLGAFLYEDINAAYNIQQTGPTCRLFPKTGKTVCYAFLQFYDAYQGEQFFGDPISGLEYRDGHVVQYFTKVSMEWQQNLPEGHKVVLSQLGRLAFDKYVGDARILWGNDPNAVTDAIPVQAPVTRIIARAFVHDALLAVGKQETIYLIVQDQDMRPVKGAQASVLAVYPDGTKFAYRPLDVTGSDGILRITIPVSRIAPRQVVALEIKVEFQGLTTNAITWFRIWY